MAWRPTVRESWWHDFEDRLDDEYSGPLRRLPNPFAIGITDTSEAADYYSRLALDHTPGEPFADPAFRDYYLRRAAQFGDAESMVELAFLRHFLHELRPGFSAEAARWAKRADWNLEKVRHERDDDDRYFKLGRVDFVLETHKPPANAGEHWPPDVDPGFVGGSATFCLRCGRLKLSTAPPLECQPQFHLDGVPAS